jgi:hypothetical protein
VSINFRHSLAVENEITKPNFVVFVVTFWGKDVMMAEEMMGFWGFFLFLIFFGWIFGLYMAVLAYPFLMCVLLYWSAVKWL